MSIIHLKAPRGWINDPNGFIYYKGKYHLFYQHFPYAPQWGRMHWGHAVSDDLTDWEHLDIALFPSKTDDMDGCFSGSAVEKDGILHIFYTGIRYEKYNPGNTNCCLDDKFIASQLKITSKDGYTFDNFCNKKTVIPTINNIRIGDKVNTRDPKVWQGKNGSYYMILGSTSLGIGRLLIYKSDNLEDWEYISYAKGKKLGHMIECPDFFEVNDNGVLICSPMGLDKGNQTVCMLADFNESDCTVKISDNRKYFDYGFDLYAPQSTTDKDGRRVVTAWLRMPNKMEDNTIGMLCIPRVCEVKSNHIYFAPHPNIKAKFTKKIASPEEANGEAYMIKTSLDENENINIGGYLIGRKNGKVYTDRTAVINGRTDVMNSFETPLLNDGYDIEIYVDDYIVEVYINNGEYVITNAVYGLTPELKYNKALEIYTLDR